MQIVKVSAYEILASGGYPTIEAMVELDNGVSSIASVPYGASAGTHEAVVLIDRDPARFNGQGMLQAINHINQEISQALIGLDPTNQRALDVKMIELDGTPNKSRLGGNAILAVSLSAARAAAKALGKPLYQHLIDTFDTKTDLSHLPQPMVVVIEGGKHADHTTDLQEFCLTAIGNQSVAQNIRIVWETYHQLRGILKAHNLSTNVGNEGAFAPEGITTNELPFAFMLEAITKAGYQAGTDIAISIDAAASEFYEDGSYHLTLENRTLSGTELITYYQTWFEKYPLVTVEDMLDEDDWDNWTKLNQICREKKIELIGDDLTVTNPARLQKAIDLQAISAILIKLNQIGTVTETMDCCRLAKEHNLSTVTSHRGGGETNDTFMVDLAVAVGSRFVKVGPTRGERVAKYNRLLAIERTLGK